MHIAEVHSIKSDFDKLKFSLEEEFTQRERSLNLKLGDFQKYAQMWQLLKSDYEGLYK